MALSISARIYTYINDYTCLHPQASWWTCMTNLDTTTSFGGLSLSFLSTPLCAYSVYESYLCKAPIISCTWHQHVKRLEDWLQWLIGLIINKKCKRYVSVLARSSPLRGLAINPNGPPGSKAAYPACLDGTSKSLQYEQTSKTAGK